MNSLHSLRHEEPLTTFDAASEGLRSLGTAHCYDSNSPRSSTLHTMEPSTSQISPLPRNIRPPQQQLGHFDLKQKLSDSVMELLGPYSLGYSALGILLYLARVTSSASNLSYTTTVCLVFCCFCLFWVTRAVIYKFKHVELYSHFDKQPNAQQELQALPKPGDPCPIRFYPLDIPCLREQISKNNEAIASLLQELELSTVLNRHTTTDTDLLKRCSEHVIPGLLDSKRTINATGDTGAKYNFLNEDYAKRCKFKIDSTARRSITIASGQKVMTTGIAEVSFCFRGERTPYRLKFHILPGCVKNVILGKSFLKATETFSNALHFAKRVVKRSTRKLNTHQVLFLGGSPPMFAGLLNGETKTALADSASKVLIMDEDYARTLGLSILSTKETRIKLRFADGSIAFTSGKTYNVSWQFGAGKRYVLDFYLLKNAPADVILNEDFLLRETGAFIEYADCLIGEDRDEDFRYYDDYFFAIYCDENYHPQAYTEGADEYFEDDREDTRRTEEDLFIASLNGAEKDAAIAKAKERRAQWAAKQAANSVAQGSQSNTINATSSSVAPQSHTSNAAEVTSTSKPQRWRFKLMKKRKSGQSRQNL